MASGWRVFLYGCFCHHYHRPQPYCSVVKGKKHVYNIRIYMYDYSVLYICVSELSVYMWKKPHNRRPHSTAHTDPNHKIIGIAHLHTIRLPLLCKIRLSLHFTRHIKTTPTQTDFKHFLISSIYSNITTWFVQ